MGGESTLAQAAAVAGTIAGLLSTGAFLPQAWRIVQRRSADDVSLAMYLAVIAASVLWIFYGWVNGSMALLVTNVCIGVIACLIVALKIRYSRPTSASRR
jgi:MtN3 and saliva related transmembrane protein